METTTARERDEMIARARREAEEIRQQAYQEGRDKGYQDGFTRGVASGKKEGLARLEGRYQEVMQILAETEKYREEICRQMEPELVRLAVTMAEKIISTQLTLDEETITHIARQALKMLIKPRFINIYVHPQDGEVLMRQKKLLGEELAEIVPINIIKKDDLPPGSCVIETDKGHVDSSVDTQIRELKKVLEIA